jgi:heme-degrading monooxygenase HmoA
LKDVYEKQARFTVMFISEHYRDKVWPNHERKATQERAFVEIDNEYILPAFFDETIEVPGLARTTGHISLEKQWRLLTLSRDSHLDDVPGFVEFHLLKGPGAQDHTLYASHTMWENRAMFEAWTKSEAFRAAHGRGKQAALSGSTAVRGFDVREAVAQ